jgi:hypothetical protein
VVNRVFDAQVLRLAFKRSCSVAVSPECCCRDINGGMPPRGVTAVPLR